MKARNKELPPTGDIAVFIPEYSRKRLVKLHTVGHC